ncbi:PQQ-like beta-propeller repeat protein [Phenylobacterium sp.]|jgi:outer membrane protein assembly factor BamB|uniref:PQQ-like beta-propeller repeat protein n=1 Tax=Phenylobacterium sp. TaxID=1871053 RepID=UPI002E2EB565|nr:PQQ-binding-like beta-propeller repeat protein [Phenylobacterium sp.]HEX4711025.1 PQQ-binding-like beta-propeller repeat protein [Phenylobacterium sp.]
MTPSRNSLLAVLLVAALGASGCSSISKFNPFAGKGGPKEVATEGERISIVTADQKLEPAEALKGVDFALPPPEAMADWPLPGGTPEQATGNLNAAPNLAIAWRRGIGMGSKNGQLVTAPPVAAAGKVFVMDAQANVSAHDAQTGEQVWRINMRPAGRRDREGFGGGLAYANGKLYVTSGFRLVAQLDAATGRVGWRTRTEQPIHGAPTVAGGRVMAVAIDNTLLTYDAATGAPGWSYQALSESARILSSSSPAVSGDTVVASFGSGELVALRTANGNDLWNEALSRASRNSALSEIRDIAGRPVIYQGDVFAVSHSGVFAATDLRTGQARWSLPVVGITSPLPQGDVVYVMAQDGRLICVSRESGQIYWVRDLNAGYVPKKKGGFWFIGGKKVLKPIWSSPILVNNRLILVGSSGELAALNAKTGEVERRVELGAPALIGPIAAGNSIYVVTDDAQLIALR